MTRYIVAKTFPIEHNHPQVSPSATGPTSVDVTHEVQYGEIISGPALPLLKCVCGKSYVLPQWLDTEDVYECDNCGRHLYFSLEIKVWELI